MRASISLRMDSTLSGRLLLPVSGNQDSSIDLAMAKMPDRPDISIAGQMASGSHSPNQNGGIDLNMHNTDLNVRKEGAGVEMNIHPAMIERIRREGISGLTPEVYSITPVISIWPLIGLEPPQKTEEVLAKV